MFEFEINDRRKCIFSLNAGRSTKANFRTFLIVFFRKIATTEKDDNTLVQRNIKLSTKTLHMFCKV